ncbi:hypothetical protein FSP39_010570 [Pinctada imbricata]|uniref:Uncharacterized protein n=1 Tax=Pinctada imbricata TaxID=66713 RepID=A0AA89C782_PINIB|nr:hypothetical protein FSP39_010570 [Pinctada imbricata]
MLLLSLLLMLLLELCLCLFLFAAASVVVVGAAAITPFTDLQTMTFNKEKRSSEWVRHAQMWISGVPRAITQSLRVEGLRTLGDGDFKPLMYDMESSWKIFAWIKLVRAGTGSAAQVQAPEAIKARLIDAERIHHDLGIIDLFNSSSVRTCKDINYASYMTAYHTASREARHRYDNKNPGIIFDDDYQVYSEKDWNNANLVVTKRGRVYHVRASSLKRKFTVEDSTDGTIYCTLLPPDRALEWIYIDSLVT